VIGDATHHVKHCMEHWGGLTATVREKNGTREIGPTKCVCELVAAMIVRIGGGHDGVRNETTGEADFPPDGPGPCTSLRGECGRLFLATTQKTKKELR
jgi:hypothetical protein